MRPPTGMKSSVVLASINVVGIVCMVNFPLYGCETLKQCII